MNLDSRSGQKHIECACGAAALEITGAHIVSVECYCNSCRAAGAHLQAMPGAPALLEANGATQCVLHRKDRVRCIRGSGHLREYRLKPDATTRRVVATCCNTAMFMEFLSGHWLSLYGRRFPPGTLPPLEMRTMTRDVEGQVSLPDDVPNGRTQPVSFMWRLLSAWVRMGFRVPAVTYVGGSLDGEAGRQD